MSQLTTLDRPAKSRDRPVRRPVRSAAPALTADLLAGAGKPLPEQLRAGLERSLGHDLADVRIHDDAQAAALADAAGAAAFVLGTHVFFAGGRYDPTSTPGRRLLVHELAHVAQRRHGGAAAGEIAACHEAEADRIAERTSLDERRAAPAAATEPAAPPLVPPPALELPALRYANATPDATAGGMVDTVHVVELITRMIARTLRTDPDDRAGRVRAQLARLTPELRDDVVAQARAALSGSDFARLEAVLEHADPGGATLSTPAVGADPENVAAAEPAATAQPQAEQQASSTHTHADGTSHTHGPGEQHDTHQHDTRQHDTHQHDKGQQHETSLFGRIAMALFGGSTLFAARSAGPSATAAAATPASAGTEPTAPGATRAPAQDQSPAGPSAAQDAGSPVSAEDEQQAEGRPAPVMAPGVAPPTGGQPPATGVQPAVPAGPRIADPQAGVTEVLSAAASGPAPAAATGQAMGSDAGALGAAAPAGAAQTEALAEPEPQREVDEDRTVLEAHANAVEAHGNVEDEPADAATAEPAPDAVADAVAEPVGEPTAASAAPDPSTAPAPVEAAMTAPEPAQPAGVTEVGADAAEPADAADAAGEPGMVAPESDPAAGSVDEAAATGPAGDAGPEPGPEVEGDAGPDSAGPQAEGGPDGAAAEGGAPAGGAPGGLAACMGANTGAQQPPAPEADAPSAGCGSGGGAGAQAEPPPAAVPDVSGSTPDAALASVGALPATDLQQALPQVGMAATSDVRAQKDAMPPPTMAQPSGAAASLDVAAPIPQRPATPYTGPSAADRIAAPPGQATPRPDLAPVPSPSAHQVEVGTPRVGGEAQLSEAEAARVVESIDQVPTSDPQLAVDAGDPGAVVLEADADPALVGRQRGALSTQIQSVASDGARDAAAPLGEAHIRPHVPPRTLTAAPSDAPCPGLSPGNRAAQRGGGSRHPRAAVDAIAAERSRADLQAGVAKAGTDFHAARDKRDTDTSQARDDAGTRMNAAVQDSHAEQVTLRRDAIGRSTILRGEWSREQNTAVDTAVSSSDTAARTGADEVTRLKNEHETTARGHIDSGNRQIREAREDAERQAREKKAEARNERHGILGWIGSKIQSFFEGLKAAITGFFDAARALVRRAIDGAKRLAHEAIELGRRAVVGAIRLAGDVIVAAGDVMLAAFPETRARFRARVEEVVDTATRKVNEAADALERGIQGLLDALGRALDCALQYLQAGYLAAVDALASVVKAALDAAQQFLDTLAEWVSIIADIARDPVGWLRALGRSAVDGARNCLFAALKRSIKQWFNDKVEEVVGVGRLIINVLVRGCISFADIARMVWDGLKAALPGIVTQLIIEKLVSLLVPAGAALSLIIDGLKAAWGAASRILAAFQKFMVFLKAVRTGSGPGAFAELVAAAAVAVIDFLSNFLVDRLKGASRGAGSSLRSMAQRIQRTLGRAGRAIGRGAAAVGRAVVRGGRAVGAVVRRGAAAVVRGGRRVLTAVGRGVRRVGALLPRGVTRAARAVAHAVDPRRLGRALARTRLGQAVGRGVGRARAWGAQQRDRLRARYDAWRERRRAAQKTPQERLAAAVAAIAPSLNGLLERGVSMFRLLANRGYWWLRYRARLVAHESGGETDFEVQVNPRQSVARAYRLTAARLLEAIDQAVPRLLARRDVRRASGQMQRDIAAGRPARLGGGAAGFPAAVSTMRSQSLRDAAAPRQNYWIVGRGSSGAGGAAVAVREVRPDTYRSAGERMVQNINRKYSPTDADAGLDRLLTRVGGGGAAADRNTARALRRVLRGAPSGLPSGTDRNHVARVAMLFAGRESGGRSLRNVALAPMTLDLVARGDLTWQRALNDPRGIARSAPAGLGTGGAYPMSFTGAGASAAFREGDQASRDAQIGRGRDLPHVQDANEAALEAGGEELERRELAMASRWLRTQNAADGGMRFRDAAHAADWVYRQLVRAYGLARRLEGRQR